MIFSFLGILEIGPNQAPRSKKPWIHACVHMYLDLNSACVPSLYKRSNQHPAFQSPELGDGAKLHNLDSISRIFNCFPRGLTAVNQTDSDRKSVSVETRHREEAKR